MNENNLSNDNDMSDVCDLLGMSSIFNKDETKNDVNLKSVEKEFIKKSLDIDETDTINNELLTYNPISEYKNLINEISENKKESSEDDDDMSEYNDIIEFATPNKQQSKSYDDDDFSYKLTQEQTNQKIVDKVLNFSDTNPNEMGE